MPLTNLHDPESFLIKAGRLVYGIVKERNADKALSFTEHDLDVIWFTKAFSEWRILFRTPLDDGLFYRVSNDPKIGEVRVDVFQQFDTIKLSNKDFR
jgi:hypothetical protein